MYPGENARRTCLRSPPDYFFFETVASITRMMYQKRSSQVIGYTLSGITFLYWSPPAGNTSKCFHLGT